MTDARNVWLKVIRHWPTRILCLFVVIVQAGFLDYYLVAHLGDVWAAIIAADTLVVGVFIAAMVLAHRSIVKEKQKGPDLTFEDSDPLPLSYASWFLYAVVLNVKMAVIFKLFAHDLKLHAFFGENTLKTSIALDGLVFVTFLTTQHHAAPGTIRRTAIEELTATVMFDVLDGVDSLDILLENESRERLPESMHDAIIAICCLTFLLPTLTFITLSVTRFGLKESGERLIRLSKLSVGYLINLPLLIIRLVLWHGLSEGVSIFALKNVIILGLTTFELLEHRFCKRRLEADTDAENRTNDINMQ